MTLGSTFNSVKLITDQTDKIDKIPVDGLLGTPDSLAYKVNEVERHIHSCGFQFGKAIAPDGELHVMQEIGPGVLPFQVNSGNLTWGNWVLVVGSEDTPNLVGSAFFDFHLFTIVGTQRNSTYFVQISEGATGGGGIASGDYCDLPPFVPISNQIDSGPLMAKTRRTSVGTKVWVRCMCLIETSGTIDFYIGIHDYEG